MIFLRNRLASEIFKFFVALSLTMNQHFDSIQAAMASCNIESFVCTLCNIIRNSKSELGTSAISCLAFLLSQEMKINGQVDKGTLLREALDTKHDYETENSWDVELQEAATVTNNVRNVIGAASIENAVEENQNECDNRLTIGADICNVLINLFVAHNYAKAKKNKQLNDKEIVTVALTNLLFVSTEAKKAAIVESFPTTIVMVLKEMYVKINSLPMQTFQTYKCQNGEKVKDCLNTDNLFFLVILN